MTRAYHCGRRAVPVTASPPTLPAAAPALVRNVSAMLVRPVLAVVMVIVAVTAARGDEQAGHSSHGAAFDTGLRQKPWRMEGIGRTHFPVTTRVADVQAWFDQGNTLLHSFWFEEAERSFRWCLKLDPDCAMAYWGLAVTGLNWFTDPALDKPPAKRGLAFLAEAVRRKAAVSPRERMYIEAWHEAFTGPAPARAKTLARELQKIVLVFPDDVEAKALYALFCIEAHTAYETELVLREVLAAEPDHPGAHHYRIHGWDWDSTTAAQALESCRRYPQVAPQVGHANHMPGHAYTKLGMWHEAAIAMDAATRVELRYMNDRLALPYETWNYAHNRNYLCYIQEQLGMAAAAEAGARSLLAAPRELGRSGKEDNGTFEQGMQALVRGLVKFARWDDILATGSIPWRDTPAHKAMRAFAEAQAFLGMGNLIDARARLATLREAAKECADPPWSLDATLLADATAGQIAAADGDLLEGTRLLLAAAAAERTKRQDGSYRLDPPPAPWPVHRLLGDVYLKHGECRLAAEAYEAALAVEHNDGFSLAGLARARVAAGDRAAATRAAGRFAAVWSAADPGLPWRRDVEALELAAAPAAETVAPERTYSLDLQKPLGPLEWQPFAAPPLDCRDPQGRLVTLDQFRGRNVLLVFYLGEDCLHCVEQLVAINRRATDWERENVVVLAVSSAAPERLAESGKLGGLALRLLSDTDHAAARRYTSYDDFEEIELHSTILIDGQGRVHWKRTGGDPFMDMDFVLAEAARINAALQSR